MDMNLEMISSESSWPKLSWVVLGELNTIDFISTNNYHFQKSKRKQFLVCHCKLKLLSTRSIDTLFGYKRLNINDSSVICRYFHLWVFECICRLSNKTCLEQSLTQCSSWMILGASTGIVSSANACGAQLRPAPALGIAEATEQKHRPDLLLSFTRF